jgi:hypothetical protein
MKGDSFPVSTASELEEPAWSLSGGMKVVEIRRFENPFSSGWIFFGHFV